MLSFFQQNTKYAEGKDFNYPTVGWLGGGAAPAGGGWVYSGGGGGWVGGAGGGEKKRRRREDSRGGLVGQKGPGGEKRGWGKKGGGFKARCVALEGTLQLTGTFRINGNVKGNIISEHTVILGEGAKVEGQIEGNRVVIAGRFDGVIFAKGRVEIQAKGVVTGEVHSPCMVVDPGGIFDGRCHMLASSDATSGVTIPIRALGRALGKG